MTIIRLYFLVLVSTLATSTGAQVHDYRSFIPKDYDTLYDGVAKGDLNNDGLEDIVLALYHKKENVPLIDTDSIPARKLIVLVSVDYGYRKSIESSKALMCKHCGGAFGDPFAGIEINKKVLVIYHYGGSAWRWNYTHKFQFRKGVMSLIGKTYEYRNNVDECKNLGYPVAYEMKDENLVTGEYEEVKVSDDCKLLKNKKGKQKAKSLISLTKFTIEN